MKTIRRLFNPIMRILFTVVIFTALYQDKYDQAQAYILLAVLFHLHDCKDDFDDLVEEELKNERED